MSKTGRQTKKVAVPERTPEEDRDRKYRRRRLYLRGGQVLMGLGALVLLQHWLFHLEAFGPGQPSGFLDLVSGYPMGGVLLMAGAILASTKPK